MDSQGSVAPQARPPLRLSTKLAYGVGHRPEQDFFARPLWARLSESRLLGKELERLEEPLGDALRNGIPEARRYVLIDFVQIFLGPPGKDE